MFLRNWFSGRDDDLLGAWPVFNDFWVFALYGFLGSVWFEYYGSQNANTSELFAALLEPFSVRAFFIISTVGYILLSAASLTCELAFGKTPSEFRRLPWVRYILAPISEVGLSAGAIIMGTSSGILLAMYEPGAGLGGQPEGFLSLLKVSVLVLAIWWPMLLHQRVTLAAGRPENAVLTVFGWLYVLAFGWVLFAYDIRVFFWVVIAMAGASVVVLGLARYFAARRNLRPGNPLAQPDSHSA